MSSHPTHAMVLAAGLGTRMRPLTLTTPKPLVRVAGKAMLDRTLDHLEAAGVQHIVVNTHWLAPQVAAHVAHRPTVATVYEPEILETGGGVANALPLLGDTPFFVLNSDFLWTDGPVPALRRLAQAWDDQTMDALLMLYPTAEAVGYEGPGDFFVTDTGDLRRRGDAPTAPFIFAGLYLVHPRLFADAPSGKFSMNILWNRALEAGRLSTLTHDGRWYIVETLAALPLVESLLWPQAD